MIHSHFNKIYQNSGSMIQNSKLLKKVCYALKWLKKRFCLIVVNRCHCSSSKLPLRLVSHKLHLQLYSQEDHKWNLYFDNFSRSIVFCGDNFCTLQKSKYVFIMKMLF